MALQRDRFPASPACSIDRDDLPVSHAQKDRRSGNAKFTAARHEARLVLDARRAALRGYGKTTVIVAQVSIEPAFHFEAVHVFGGMQAFIIVVQFENIVPGGKIAHRSATPICSRICLTIPFPVRFFIAEPLTAVELCCQRHSHEWRQRHGQTYYDALAQLDLVPDLALKAPVNKSCC